MDFVLLLENSCLAAAGSARTSDFPNIRRSYYVSREVQSCGENLYFVRCGSLGEAKSRQASEYFCISINNLQLFYEGGLLCVKN